MSTDAIYIIDDFIEQQLTVSLSSDDIVHTCNLLNLRVKLLLYKDIPNPDDPIGRKDFLNYLTKYDAVVLLYMSTYVYGHWTCIFRRRNQIIFFDSYGIFPDDELNFKVSEEISQLKFSDVIRNHMRHVLAHTTYTFHYNQYVLQGNQSTPFGPIATCGKHVLCRLAYKNLSTDEYVRMLDSKLRKCNRVSPYSKKYKYDYLVALWYVNASDTANTSEPTLSVRSNRVRGNRISRC